MAAPAFLADRRGAVATLTALCMMALLGCAAMGVDLGNLFLRSRELQGVADLAALASVQTLDAAATTTAQQAAAATAAANPWPGSIAAAAASGTYAPDPATPAAQRFTAGTPSPNAVQVSLTAPVPLYFAGLITGRSTMTIVRTAVAARAEYAAFSIGSGLASLNGGVANAVLSAMTGSKVSLGVMDYQALASAEVDLLQYVPALQARAGLTGLSYGQVLASSVQPSAALYALADELDAGGQTAAAAAARGLAAAASGLSATPLSSVLDLGPYDAQDHGGLPGQVSLKVQALSLAQAVVAAANGQRQLAVYLDGLAPGLARLNLSLAIGQRPNHSPWLTVASAGQVIVRTAQMRLYLQASLAPGLLPTGGSMVALPIYVEAGSAAARLAGMECPSDPASRGFDLSVAPSLGAFAIAAADPAALGDFGDPVGLSTATLVDGGLVKATAYGRADLGGSAQAGWRTVHFTSADVGSGTAKSVFASDVARASVASLLTDTTLNVETPGGGVGVTPVAAGPGLAALLTAAAPSLDAVIAEVEALSGARLGEADVWADGLRCRGAALVA